MICLCVGKTSTFVCRASTFCLWRNKTSWGPTHLCVTVSNHWEFSSVGKLSFCLAKGGGSMEWPGMRVLSADDIISLSLLRGRHQQSTLIFFLPNLEIWIEFQNDQHKTPGSHFQQLAREVKAVCHLLLRGNPFHPEQYICDTGHSVARCGARAGACQYLWYP